MSNFEIVIFLMTILIILSAFTDKIKLPYPILLVVAGLVVGFAPFLPNLALDPNIVFIIFLPPLLYHAAFNTPWLDFKKEIRPISTLAISLVFFTTVTVATAAHFLIPGFSWPVAFILGAIVSPPDAVAATSITKGLGLNRRVLTIIEGESLVNDASALIAYRYSVAAAVSGTFIFWKAGLEFLLVSTGGIAIGIALGFIFVFAHKKIKENAIVETSLSLLTPFAAYLLAEHAHTSGVLAVVSAGLFVSWRSRELFSYETRLQTKVVWDTAIFLLNGIVFILIGLQLPGVVNAFKRPELFHLIGYGLIISACTILIRIIWVFAGAYHQSVFRRKTRAGQVEDAEPVSWKNVLIVAWTGTRGVVSLATALALPVSLGSNKPFSERNTILLLGFIVILVTLVVQGLTLPLLIRLLRIKPVVGEQKKEEESLQLVLTEKVLHFIDRHFPVELDPRAREKLKQRYATDLEILSKKDSGSYKEKKESESKQIYHNQVRLAQHEILKYQREQLIRFHKEGTFADETINKAERELDIEELRLQTLLQKGDEE